MSNVGKSCGNTPDLEKKKKTTFGESTDRENDIMCLHLWFWFWAIALFVGF